MRDYDKLDTLEAGFVDSAISTIMDDAKIMLMSPLVGDDRCERFADALARWVIESREARKP